MSMKWIYAIYRDLKLPDFPNFVFFGCEIDNCSQTLKPQIPNDIPFWDTMYEP